MTTDYTATRYPAAFVCNDRADEASELVAALAAVIEDARDGGSWGHAADLGRINTKLRELLNLGEE